MVAMTTTTLAISALSFDTRPVRREAKTKPRRTAPRMRYRKVPVATCDGMAIFYSNIVMFTLRVRGVRCVRLCYF